MKFDGNTRISICYEDKRGKITIENYTLNEIVKYIAAQSFVDVQIDKDYRNKITKYIIIKGKKYDLKTDINIEYETSLLCVPIICKGYFKQKYTARSTIKIEKFYNDIVELVEEYAYELDTDMNNINVSVKELELLKEGV